MGTIAVSISFIAAALAALAFVRAERDRCDAERAFEAAGKVAGEHAARLKLLEGIYLDDLDDPHPEVGGATSDDDAPDPERFRVVGWN